MGGPVFFQSLKRLQQPEFMPSGHFHEPPTLSVLLGTIYASIYPGGGGEEDPEAG